MTAANRAVTIAALLAAVDTGPQLRVAITDHPAFEPHLLSGNKKNRLSARGWLMVASSTCMLGTFMPADQNTVLVVKDFLQKVSGPVFMCIEPGTRSMRNFSGSAFTTQSATKHAIVL